MTTKTVGVKVNDVLQGTVDVDVRATELAVMIAACMHPLIARHLEGKDVTHADYKPFLLLLTAS